MTADSVESAPLAIEEGAAPTEQQPKSPPQSESTSSSSIIRWSKALLSPQEPGFSPSREVRSTTNSHGWALFATTDRARKFSRQTGRAVALLLDVTTVYDQHAQALLKAGQSLNSLIAGQVSDAVAAQESLVFWSGETSKLSSVWRTDLAPQWQAFLNAYGDSVHAIHEKYQLSRSKSAAIRQRAVRAQSRYARATQEAEQAVSEWKMNRKEEAPPKLLTQKLKDLQRREAHYKKFVEWENECVKQCERMEVMSLDSLQKMEEDCLKLFSESLVEALQAQKHALDEVMLSMKQQSEHAENAAASSADQQDRQQAYLRMKRSSLSGSILFDEGTGAMDAETMGLPEAVGQLRDQVRTRMAARSTRVKTFRVLAGFLEYLCVALERFSSSLKQIVQREQKGLESVLDEMKEQEGSSSKIVDLWERLIQTLKVESDEAARCSVQLRKVSTEKLDSMVIYGDKLLNAAADSEDLVWKQLCEAGRAANKAEERLVQTTAEKLKARERITSVDAGKEAVEAPSPIRVSKHVSRSLANMFSVLPNGGEHAMKILDRGTVASIAQHNLEDADEKEAKGRQALDSALGLRSQLAEKYKTNARSWLTQFETEDRDGWGDLSVPFQSLSAEIQSSREKILSTMGALEDAHPATCATVMNQWVKELQETLSTEPISPDGFDYQLSPRLVEAPTLTSWMPAADDSQNDVSVDEAFDDDDELDEEAPEEPGLFATNSGSKDGGLFSPDKRIFGGVEGGIFKVAGGSSRDEDDSPIQEPPAPLDDKDANWLGMSNSMSDSIRGKFTFRKRSRRRYKRYTDVSMETELFATYFWSDKVDPQSIPSVIDSFSCSMRGGKGSVGSQYGRVFVSDVRLVFVGWAGQKLSLRHDEDVIAVEPCKKQMDHSDEALQVTYKKGTAVEPITFWLDGFFDMQKALDLFGRAREEAIAKAEQLRKEKEAAEQAAAEKAASSIPAVPPDSTLSKMEVVISRHLRNLSIQRFYELVWSEGINTTDKPLYGPWLKEGCLDVEVAPWEFVNCAGPWDQEKYTQRRDVKFRVQRKTHLYIGPPIAEVKQTQFCRVEGQDKCVLGMSVAMEGIPYSDCFVVEVRWVARREGDNDIFVEVGVFVDFKKSTLLKNKIRSGTLVETTSTHESLFDCVKKACIAAGGEAPPETDEKESLAAPSKGEKAPIPVNKYMLGAVIFLLVCLYYVIRLNIEPVPRALSSDTEYLAQRIEGLEEELGMMKATLNEVLSLLKEQRKLTVDAIDVTDQ